jgi:hypothetical protein
MKLIPQRAALLTILSSIFFIASNVYSIVSLIISNSVSPLLVIRLTLVAFLYCICLAVDIYVGVQLLKIIKKQERRTEKYG